ncbi:hypothetical protein ABZ671_22230 [Micromonospora sp. NPDC006766]|uniref:Rv0361 family membrane protein n=1 Tax=Micromonospora sp. NPDC006766 TaxID=3154778 RepID=UPI0033CB7C76
MGSKRQWSRPARRIRPGRAGLLFGGLGFGVCLIGVAGLALWNVQVMWRAGGPVRETADGFLHDVAAGETDRAYDRLCRQARGKWSAVGFGSWVRTPPQVRGYEITDVSVATQRGIPRATVKARLTRDGGGSEDRTLSIVQEDGRWRVCGDPF